MTEEEVFETLASLMTGLAREAGWTPDMIFGQMSYIQLLLIVNRWSQEAEDLEIERDFAEAQQVGEVDTVGFFRTVLEKDGRIGLAMRGKDG